MITALYDGQCVICRCTRRVIVRLDWCQRVEFLDIHDWDTVHRRYPDLDVAAAWGQIHVVTADGRLSGGFLALRSLLRELPLGFPVWLLLHGPGMPWLGARVYRFVARHRYRINRLLGVDLDACENDTCQIMN